MGELLTLDLLRTKREDYSIWERMDLREEKKRCDCLKLCLKRKEDSLMRKVLALDWRSCW